MRKSLILDTCALIWLTTGDKMLSSEATEAINSAPLVYVSPISAWEISLKIAREKIRWPLPLLEWFFKTVEKHTLHILPLSVELLVKANELPWHHRDPADRFIIAGAMLNDLVIVTRDRRFLDYGVPLLS
jgi:PIN domain nuclease of toxin-antitoxin system